MKWRTIYAIARKDWIEAFQNQSVVLPMVIVPFIFIVLMPLAMIVLPNLSPEAGEMMLSDPDFNLFFERMPPFLQQFTAGLEPLRSVILMVVGLLFAPFFLILPLMFSTVIAAESFAGERERKTVEALLYTPATDSELFLGKVLAAMAPAVGITWISFLIYILVVNLSSYLTMNWVWFPLPTWYPLIFWVAPALSLLGISVTVLISARTPTFMGAYQSSAMLVLLVLGLLVGQITGVLYLTVWVGIGLGFLLWGVSALLTFLAIKTFNRSKLLSSVN